MDLVANSLPLWRGIAAGAALMVALTACTSSSPAEQSESTSSAELPEAITDAASPIAAAVGNGATSEGQSEMQHIEELIQQCMQAHGFAYLPRPVPPTEETTPNSAFDGEDGYGVTTHLFEENETALSTDQGAVTQDPNIALTAEMNDNERDAWLEALWGPVEVSPDGSDTASGCQREAEEAVLTSPLNADWFNAAYDDMYDRMTTDSRWVALDQQWSACMDEQGYAFATVNDLYERLNEKVQPFYAIQAEFSINEPVVLTDEQANALAEAQDWERKVAQADQSCRNETKDERDKLTHEYEVGFVAEHYGELAPAATP